MSDHYLPQINSPADLKQVPLSELPAVCAELRAEIIEVVSAVGGHLASPLGAVELAAALHYVFNSPWDRMVWDVGHQAYAHKLLTGRRQRFATLKQQGGISGFCKTQESEHDALTVGHASTSLAAALGMAIARDLQKEDREIVAVIGDGGLTGGMALAALNQLGSQGRKVLVIINDNQMSISPNVGALKKYLNRARLHPTYRELMTEVSHFLEHVPFLREGASRAKDAIKDLLMSHRPFEAWGFEYYGPVNGHDVIELVKTLQHMRPLKGPTILHALTQKGYGYALAEQDPVKWHSPGLFKIDTGEVVTSSSYTFSNAFGDALIELAATDPRVVCITPAMREGSGLVEFEKRFPERYVDVGIAEDVAVTCAAGLALRGMRPVVAIYSTFLQRAYDQVIHDIALDNLPVLFCIDRAGLVGADGPTHHGVFDLSYLRCIPNLALLAPTNALELKEMMRLGLAQGGPVAIRYPRGNAPRVAQLDTPLAWGKGEVLRRGADLALLGIGLTVSYALRAAELLAHQGIRATVVNAR
ncbi:MAG: 1-deoxy-D-xylulose-5-phosphate synthase, partial [Deinococcus sp.]|nr:1-deoxy-D-xylulose-5-phosphate synthase [Deinococcus sp.]